MHASIFPGALRKKTPRRAARGSGNADSPAKAEKKICGSRFFPFCALHETKRAARSARLGIRGDAPLTRDAGSGAWGADIDGRGSILSICA
jgi:hypothetical protein